MTPKVEPPASIEHRQRGPQCRYPEEKGSSLQAHGEVGSRQARRQRPSLDDANRVVVEPEFPAGSNNTHTHTHTVSRSRSQSQCTGAPAAGCARHSPQARRQHAGPDLGDLVPGKVEGPAGSNITHTHTRSAAAAAAARASAQVHQQQGAPGTHVRPDGSTPAPISLMSL